MAIDIGRLGAALLRWRRAIVFAAPAAAGLILLAGGQGAGLDQQLRNLRDSIRSHPASGQVHIVEIDARSLSEIDRWPWPRGVHAAIIDKLSQSGARSVTFDVDFSATSTPGEDAKLAAALERAGRSVVLPTFRQGAGSGSSGYVDSVPAKPFKNKSFLAAVNVLPDADGYVRQMLLGVETAGTSRPSLATMIAERNAEIDRSFTIDYAIAPDSIPRHSVVDLIAGRVPASAIAGKRFLVGATAVEMGDRYAVPGHGVIPGVVIQAIAAETLMAGPIPRAWSGVLPLALALLLVGIALRLRARAARVGLVAAGTVAILALPLATEALLAVSMQVAPGLAVLAAAMLLSALAFAVDRYLESARTDEATGLPNLAALEQAAAGGQASIVVARIDRFATIASGLGPVATATLVRRVAERLQFTQPDRIVYRTDAASLAWMDRADEAESLEQRLDALDAVMRSPVECGRLVDVTLAFGVADGEAGGAKQQAANAALAAANAAQRGVRWQRFVATDSDEIAWQLSLLGELDAALAGGQVWIAYQPKLDLRTGEIIGVEALVRWAHPERGPIGPDDFIPIVEQAGRIRDLTAHVFGQALEDALAWDEAGLPLGIAVNVSATLLADHEFIETVGQMLQSHKLPADRVTIEVTESAAMASPERAIAALESWRSHGVAISIDDYGTGQSSLGYLQKIPATELKIDKSFVQSVVTDSRNAIMVRSTIALAHELGMTAVAEGIEDPACLKMLGEMGCDTAQGYHIARPMPADQLLVFLAERSRQAA